MTVSDVRVVVGGKVRDMVIISLGLGVQSSCLYYLSSAGVIPRADYAIFADTGAESKATLEYLDYIQDWGTRHNGIPIKVARYRNITEELFNKATNGKRLPSMPLHTILDGKQGMLRRQCTYEYKIRQVEMMIREIYGLKPHQRFPKTEIMIGISTDEASRMKPSRDAWSTRTYPLIDLNYSRTDCMKYMQDNGIEVPPKSSCIFCPYQSEYRWKHIKKNDRWETVKAVDVIIRKMGNNRDKLKADLFLSKHMLPIDQVDFGESQLDLFENECEGGCGL